MSRGFVREGDQEETPLVTPRANLPIGVDNYVTAHGLNELKAELSGLIEEQKILIAQSNEVNRVQINYIASKLQLLEERINSAKVVDLASQPHDKIYFGATITLFKELEQCECKYQIVGVDEANISHNKVSFLSPIAKTLLNKKIGDTISLQTPKGGRIMKVEAIEYI